MKLLLDTCAFIWAADAPAKLSATATGLIKDPQNDLTVSVASLWEIGIKLKLNKLHIFANILGLIQAAEAQNIEIIPIPPMATHIITTLPMHHTDPFDRIIVATAMVSNVPVVTIDTAFDLYGVNRLW